MTEPHDPQIKAFESEDLEPKPPDKAMRWRCIRCGSERVIGVSLLDESRRYAIAARCIGCHRVNVAVQRDIRSP